MWHASVSLQHQRRGLIEDEAYVERAAIDTLAGVGESSEWWCYPRGIGHLRVPVTRAEAELIPPGCVNHRRRRDRTTTATLNLMTPLP